MTAFVASVSVVVPCFRCAKTLARSVASIAEQSVLPREVILVDDGSGDETRSLMASLQAKYMPGWIQLVLLDVNSGVATARNAGWNLATSDYVAFLDADDTWHPQKLELQWRHFEQNPSLTLLGHTFRFPWDADVELAETIAPKLEPIGPWQILFHNPFVTPSVMIRRDIPLRFHSGKRHMEDHLLWMEVVLNGHSCQKMYSRLATIGKPQFGASGLSSNLWAMERGDLDNYWQLRRSRHISWLSAFLLSLYSWAKFLRRLIIVGARHLLQNVQR